MVKEPVKTDGVKVMLDQKTTDVLVSQKMITMLSMMMMLNVTSLLSILNVTSQVISLNSLIPLPALIGNQNPSVYQEVKPSKSMIYVTSLDKKLLSLNPSLVSMILNLKC
jgi:hypothetical protein